MILALIALIALSPTESDVPSLAEARGMAVPMLASRVLGLAGNRMREARVEASSPQEGKPPRLQAIVFAEAARASGERGLCSARTLKLWFNPVDGSDAIGPPAASFPMISTLWAVLPDPAAPARACGSAAPVLADEELATFFPMVGPQGGDVDASAAAVAVQLLRQLDTGKGLSSDQISCRGNAPEFCDDPRAALLRVDTLRPSGLSMEHCPDAPLHLCIDASFDPVRTGPRQGSFIRLRVTTDGAPTDLIAPTRVNVVGGKAISSGPQPHRILRVTIEQVNWIA
ncbi:MAG TPA: hypothetical protein VF695_15730 [Sphingomonas sp.]